MDSARLILGGVGIRAANEGQLGGGVSIRLESPEGMEWADWASLSEAQKKTLSPSFRHW